MSIEDVERILDETQESIEYQRVKFFIFILSQINMQQKCKYEGQIYIFVSLYIKVMFCL